MSPGELSDDELSDDDMSDDDFFLDESEDSAENEGGGGQETGIADPFAPINRAVFHFNDKLYFWLLKPVAKGYKAVIPQPVRTGVKNFFHNLGTPVRLVNCILQGKTESTGKELSRFIVNTTIGFLGFGDPAKSKFKIDPADEDFGQTLAFYGVGDGFYIVWPFLGPSTLRDTAGMGADYFLDPLYYSELTLLESAGLSACDKVNALSFRIGDYEALKEAAFDPYDSFRNFYLQYRQKKIAE